jgi:hypothetical protein
MNGKTSCLANSISVSASRSFNFSINNSDLLLSYIPDMKMLHLKITPVVE